jgi:hypothetical protein
LSIRVDSYIFNIFSKHLGPIATKIGTKSSIDEGDSEFFKRILQMKINLFLQGEIKTKE